MSDLEVLLSDPAALMDRDAAALLPAAATAGAQVRSSPLSAASALAAFVGLRPRALVVIAQGRAAADAAIGLALIGSRSPVPTLVSAVLPSWIGALDAVVVFASDGDSGGLGVASAVEIARRRGAAVLVRAAADGEMAYAAGPSLSVPAMGIPEALAGPSRLTTLLMVAGACGLLGEMGGAPTSAEIGLLADLLDAQSLMCAPSSEMFMNPAKALALHLVSGMGVLIGSEPVGDALTAHGAGVLAEIAGYPAAVYTQEQLSQAPALVERLTRRPDIFADPFDELLDGDDAPIQLPLRPVVLKARPAQFPPVTGFAPLLAWYSTITRALPNAIALDGPELVMAHSQGWRSGSFPTPTGAESDGPFRPLIADWAAAAVMMLRLDFAAVYIGVGAGQAAPLDSPAGLGGQLSGRGALRPDTVMHIARDQEDVDRWN
ncbi:hypothetical protein EH165_10525 [Nakamurella antarctica]|uniref:SIS domain-containing protein n=1 Tax=Nakamurella antarctica TaxID=1902245 RepID=A0A3G8ZXY2_9ACTN|nr:hypothetical protein [Nakamurella antarctica]AZI58501.1 hypothetical protein EH165_10525 [Nakamurella antarctica]